MIAAVVILFHPVFDDVLDNLSTYASIVDKLLLWRNSPEPIRIPPYLAKKTIILGDGNNEFMAKPLNQAIEWCYNNGYDYLLTMDQDSKWVNADYFISRALSSKEDNIAIFSPYVQGQYTRPKDDYDAESVITSGSLVSIQIARSLGGFREDYRIYWVDGEFCYWARLNNYKIKVLHDCTLLQRFGKQTKTLFGFTTSNYSPIVYYFLIRNMIWMKREFNDGVSVKTLIYTLIYNLRGILLGENDKIRKVHYINKGIVHGLFRHFDHRPVIL